MVVFILILLLLAAIAGVLGTVLKIAFALILATILAVVVVASLFWWAVKRQMRKVVDGTAPGTGRVWYGGRVYDTRGDVRPERDDPPTSLPGS